MWPGGVVMDPPGFDNDPGMGQADEPFFVQTFITEPPVEAFSKGIVHRFAGLDEV